MEPAECGGWLLHAAGTDLGQLGDVGRILAAVHGFLDLIEDLGDVVAEPLKVRDDEASGERALDEVMRRVDHLREFVVGEPRAAPAELIQILQCDLEAGIGGMESAGPKGGNQRPTQDTALLAGRGVLYRQGLRSSHGAEVAGGCERGRRRRRARVIAWRAPGGTKSASPVAGLCSPRLRRLQAPRTEKMWKSSSSSSTPTVDIARRCGGRAQREYLMTLRAEIDPRIWRHPIHFAAC